MKSSNIFLIIVNYVQMNASFRQGLKHKFPGKLNYTFSDFKVTWMEPTLSSEI